MKRISFAAVTVIASLALLASGCGAPAPEPRPTPPPPTATKTPLPATPEIAWRDYVNESLGLSMRCPEGWVFQEQEELVTFATSKQVIERGGGETGAYMRVWRFRLDDWGEETSLEGWFAGAASVLGFMETSQTEPCTVGGQDGLRLTYQGTPQYSETAVKGFYAGIEREGWGYCFQGMSPLEEWPEYAPALEGMLESVEFAEQGTSQ